MSSGTCPNCGKENLKNIEVHMRYCKNRAMTQEPILEPILVLPPEAPAEPIPVAPKTLIEKIEENHPDIKEAMKSEEVKPSLKERILNRGKRPIIIHMPDKNFSDEGMTEEQKVKQLLKDAPLWTKYKPKGIGAKIAKIMNPNVSFASCVFVSEHDQPKILYMPYEPEKNRLIIPDKGFYIPSQSAPPFFFHSDYSLELIHVPALKDKFNIPAHVIQAKYNAGLMEGTLKSGKELLDEIKKYKMVCYLLGIVALVALVALIGVSYTYDSNYRAIAEQTNNLTTAINSINYGRKP